MVRLADRRDVLERLRRRRKPVARIKPERQPAVPRRVHTLRKPRRRDKRLRHLERPRQQRVRQPHDRTNLRTRHLPQILSIRKPKQATPNPVQLHHQRTPTIDQHLIRRHHPVRHARPVRSDRRIQQMPRRMPRLHRIQLTITLHRTQRFQIQQPIERSNERRHEPVRIANIRHHVLNRKNVRTPQTTQRRHQIAEPLRVTRRTRYRQTTHAATQRRTRRVQHHLLPVTLTRRQIPRPQRPTLQHTPQRVPAQPNLRRIQIARTNRQHSRRLTKYRSHAGFLKPPLERTRPSSVRASSHARRSGIRSTGPHMGIEAGPLCGRDPSLPLIDHSTDSTQPKHPHRNPHVPHNGTTHTLPPLCSPSVRCPHPLRRKDSTPTQPTPSQPHHHPRPTITDPKSDSPSSIPSPSHPSTGSSTHPGSAHTPAPPASSPGLPPPTPPRNA